MEITRIGATQRFSRAVVHANTVYLSGVIAVNPAPTVREQTAQVLERLDQMLASAGTDKSKLLSTTILLTDLANIADFNEVWDQWVAPECAPARTPIVSQLNGAGLLVEVIATAAL